jgi:DMSO reductase anchor subunit
MHPAFSVIFLTTLIGVGQGFFLALFTVESYSALKLLPQQDHLSFYALGSAISLIFLIGGLIASIFHLGHPERAWRAIAQWKTSWLSREVIALPLMMGLVFLYGVAHFFNLDVNFLQLPEFKGQLTISLGILATLATFALFVCTGMVYAGIKFLQEWANPITVVNYILLGGASGFCFAALFAAFQSPDLTIFYASWALIITTIALITRGFSLYRNARLKYISNIQSAIGVRHTQIKQKAMGFMGGSFNTREYFHGATLILLKSIKWIFLILVFAIPLILLGMGLNGDKNLLMVAFVAQYVGLLFERWFFFAQANHPQNLYYQTI